MNLLELLSGAPTDELLTPAQAGADPRQYYIDKRGGNWPLGMLAPGVATTVPLTTQTLQAQQPEFGILQAIKSGLLRFDPDEFERFLREAPRSKNIEDRRPAKRKDKD